MESTVVNHVHLSCLFATSTRISQIFLGIRMILQTLVGNASENWNERGVWGQNVSTMEIAQQRIQECVNGILDLSHLGLYELPPLPHNLIVLQCTNNQLSSLPDLPSSLQVLQCSSNQLTSLPTLPPWLRTFTCQFNQLTTLPALPPHLTMMLCDANQFETLPDLPQSLTYLSCSMNRLVSLPHLPQRLEKLYCSQNTLKALPELPSTLVGLACALPHNDTIYISNEMTPEIVRQLNHEHQEWIDPHSKERCNARCKIYKEGIMMKAWHPTRMKMLLDLGYDVEDM